MNAQPQHMQALDLANHDRLYRATVKRGIGSGDTTIREVLGTRPRECRNMAIAELLRAQRHWGRLKVTKFCSRLAISEGRRLSQLTARQTQSILDELERRHA